MSCPREESTDHTCLVNHLQLNNYFLLLLIGSDIMPVIDGNDYKMIARGSTRQIYASFFVDPPARFPRPLANFPALYILFPDRDRHPRGLYR
jgi:hypothetical protein